MEEILKSAGPDSLTPRWTERALYSLSDGLVLLDARRTVVFGNPRAEQLLGWPAEEMLGRRADEMVDRMVARAAAPDKVRVELLHALAQPADDSTVEMELASLPASEERLSASPNPARGRDRATRFISLCTFSLKPAPRETGGGDSVQVGSGILLRDVTREREADAMKTQLLSTVSHELRTPLASIKGFATTLLRQDVRWDDPTQRDFLHIIEEEADRLTEIIDNLLDMSQLEAGMLRVEKEPVQFRMLIRDIVDEMRMQTEAHWFVVDLPAELPSVLADSRRIRQVLHNLIENAVKYSKGGQITISCEVEGEHIVVSVSDQGQGIPPEFLDQVFERFFQIDGASTRRVGGSGLGLSISRGIVEAHGGTIWAESEVGKGSTFRFTLPLSPEEPDE